METQWLCWKESKAPLRCQRRSPGGARCAQRPGSFWRLRKGHISVISHLAFERSLTMSSELSHEAACDIFIQLGRRARELGISKQKLSQLHSIRLLQSFESPKRKLAKRTANNHNSNSARNVLFVASLVAILFLFIVLRLELHTWNGFAKAWLTWKRRDVHSEQVNAYYNRAQ